MEAQSSAQGQIAMVQRDNRQGNARDFVNRPQEFQKTEKPLNLGFASQAVEFTQPKRRTGNDRQSIADPSQKSEVHNPPALCLAG